MKASRITVSTFGTILGIAGLEHGVGEILQGNNAPDGLFIQSWPNNPLYNILAGEPALTIVPNYLLTGILAILASTILIAWVIFFIERNHGGLILILLSILLILVGGGLAGPLLMGIILGITTTRFNSEYIWMKKHPSTQDSLSKLWKFSFIVSILGWFSLWPGIIVLGLIITITEGSIIILLTLISFLTMLLTIFSSFAYDSVRI